MNILKTILISSLVSAVSIIGFYYYLPFEISELNGGGEMLGTTITTIAGSDTLKNSRTTINNNFSALNNGKVETSTTSMALITTLENLASIGTLTTGTWNASTLTVAYGGTGSTTLLSNAVLLGNGTSMIKAVPAGSEGQVLTLSSGGPVWGDGTIDQTIAYNWTGKHSWTASTTFGAQIDLDGFAVADSLLIASGTLMEYPNASTSIATKGYVDKKYKKKLAVNATQYTINTSETAFVSATVPGGDLGINNGVRAIVHFSELDAANAQTLSLKVKYGATTLITLAIAAGADVENAVVVIVVLMLIVNATNSQKATLRVFGGPERFDDTFAADVINGVAVGTAAEDSTADKTFQITAQFNGGTNKIVIETSILELIR
jgi:hypothetical protein